MARRGSRHACPGCGTEHCRAVDLCHDCDDTPPPDNLALTGGHWQPGRHGILRYVT